jgi:zinc-ribbon domain
MFCSNCGEQISEGKAFCKHCGTPVGVSPVPEPGAGAVRSGDTVAMDAATIVAPGANASEAATVVAAPVADEAATVVQPPAEDVTLVKGAVAGDTGPLPPVAEARKVVPPPVTTAVSTAPAAPAPPAAPAGPPPAPLSPPPAPPPLVDYALGTPPAYLARSQGQPPRRGRGGLIAGIVVAVMIVLAAAGVAAFLLLRDDGSAVPATTTVQATTSTVAAQSTTTAPASSTTLTTAAPSTTTSIATTSTTLDSVQQYLTATDALVQILVEDDARIPELAQQINASAPHVPQSVDDELQAMMGKLDAAVTELSALPVPGAFQASHKWLAEAAKWMGERIDATSLGVEAMWKAGTVNAGKTYFKQGQVARDNYRAALQKFQGLVPID